MAQATAEPPPVLVELEQSALLSKSLYVNRPLPSAGSSTQLPRLPARTHDPWSTMAPKKKAAALRTVNEAVKAFEGFKKDEVGCRV